LAKNEWTSLIFRVQNPEEILHQAIVTRPPHLNNVAALPFETQK